MLFSKMKPMRTPWLNFRPILLLLVISLDESKTDEDEVVEGLGMEVVELEDQVLEIDLGLGQVDLVLVME